MLRSAFTLLELIIALAIFAVVMAMVIETSTSISSYAHQHDDLLTLEEEGRMIMRQVTWDLSQTTWGPETATSYPVVNRASRPIPSGSYGDEIQFLRVRSVMNIAQANGFEPIIFSNANFTPFREWKTPKSSIPGLVLNLDYAPYVDEEPLVGVVFEPANLTDTVDYESNRLTTNLAIYRYKPFANPITGQATLRREKSINNGITWGSRQDFGQHVYQFEVAEITDPSERPQQLTVTLLLRHYGKNRISSASPFLERKFESVITMRSTGQ
jgi:prepilin-type N-terminal cleavage/methylation domain-containing protein